jgi:PTS system maltose and glucose-specific IIC component
VRGSKREKAMKRAVNALQNFGKSLYGPVLILPIVGLFIAFGNVLGNGNLAEYLPFLGHPLIQHLGQLDRKICRVGAG